LTIFEILFIMIFLHIIDDFMFQKIGNLEDLKQVVTWKPYGDKYKNDYIVALIYHGFEWSCMISIPLFILGWKFLLPSILVNTIIHSIVDDQKANRFKLTLIQDQVIHMFQIGLTLVLYYFTQGG